MKIVVSVPRAVKTDPELYDLLCLVDALRIGRARERALAEQELSQRLACSGLRVTGQDRCADDGLLWALLPPNRRNWLMFTTYFRPIPEPCYNVTLLR